MDYAKLYNDLISFRKSNPLKKSKELYTEKHHIVPKCLGGSDDRGNIVRLTPREHFIAHRLLAKMYPDHAGLALAVIIFTDRFKVSSREFVRLRKLHSERMSGDKNPMFGMNGDKNPMFGVRHSTETIQKMSDAQSGAKNPMFGRTCENSPWFGKKHSVETILKMSYNKIGDMNPMFGTNRTDTSRRKQSEAWKMKFLPYGYAASDRKHFFWERADLLMFHMLRIGSTKVTYDILRDVYDVADKSAEGTARTIAKRIFKYGWNPLEDDRWVAYTEERSKLSFRTNS